MQHANYLLHFLTCCLVLVKLGKIKDKIQSSFLITQTVFCRGVKFYRLNMNEADQRSYVHRIPAYWARVTDTGQYCGSHAVLSENHPPLLRTALLSKIMN